MDMLPYSKGTMSKPTASGIARMSDSTQMVTISMIVSRGMPTPWTLLQEATALYLQMGRHTGIKDGLDMINWPDFSNMIGAQWLTAADIYL